MESKLETMTAAPTEAHEYFKETQARVYEYFRAWEHAQGRYERAAVGQGMDGLLTRRAHASLLEAYDRFAVARAEHEVARRRLWETAKLAQIERDLETA